MSRSKAAANEQDAIDLWFALLRTTADVRAEVGEVLAHHGLTRAQWGVLRVVGEAGPEGIMLSHIGENLVFSNGNTTGIVDRLEEAGYLRRLPHPDDRRAILAVLTDSGRTLYEQVTPAFRGRVAELVGFLTPDQRESLRSILAALSAKATGPDVT